MNKAAKAVLVVAGVIARRGRYLVCRRPLEKRHGGLWEFPGGKLLHGESAFDGAKRELREELELEVTAVGDPLLSVNDPGSEFEIQFCPVEIAGEPVAIEHSEIRWVGPEDLLALDLAPTDRRFADILVSGRGS